MEANRTRRERCGRLRTATTLAALFDSSEWQALERQRTAGRMQIRATYANLGFQKLVVRT